MAMTSIDLDELLQILHDLKRKIGHGRVGIDIDARWMLEMDMDGFDPDSEPIYVIGATVDLTRTTVTIQTETP